MQRDAVSREIMLFQNMLSKQVHV